MRRPFLDIRLSKVNTGLLVSGAALLLVASLSRWVTIGGNQILRGAPWWVEVVVGAVGLLAISLAVLVSRGPVQGLRAGQVFLGAPPRMPTPGRMVERPDLSAAVVAALRPREGPVALTGVGGVGKSTLAAAACGDRRVRRWFRDGVTWLEAVPGQDPVGLLSDLARRLGLPDGASGFASVGRGRDMLATALHGRRMLVVVDDVWERGPLDALALPGCTVMFTTRLPELAATFGANQIRVDELTQSQALELLGRWTGQTLAELPARARALCTRLGNLALGVTMAGAMLARGRSLTDVVALIEQDLDQVHANLDPAYPYRSLLAAVEAGISDLPEADQQRYVRLAVFAGRGPFPREAAGALWWPELAKAQVGGLLAELVGRSLLLSAGDGWYTAHDLQYDVLKRRLSPEELAAAHARLLESYRKQFPGGWADSAADPYLAGALAGHLHDAGRDGELQALLTDVAWIQARLVGGQLPGLLSDYGYVADPLTRQVVRALRLSSHILSTDPGQVRGQLAGRLMGHPDPAVAGWATGVTQRDGPGLWLTPLTPVLTPTTTALEQVLTGDARLVSSVAVTADGARAVSGSYDGTLRVWDLATGQEQASSAAATAICGRWRSPRTGPRRSAAAASAARCGYGTWPPDESRRADRPRRLCAVSGGHRRRGQGD